MFPKKGKVSFPLRSLIAHEGLGMVQKPMLAATVSPQFPHMASALKMKGAP